MPETCNNEALYFGLKLYELLTLIGIIIGPIVAVIITLVTESSGQKRERQIQVMRMLLNMRNMPSDPAYSVGINLIPVEFSKKKKVMEAWKTYIETVRFKPSPENKESHDDLLKAKQIALIYQMMKSLGFNLSETDIQTSAYIAGGFIARDNLYLDSLQEPVAKFDEEIILIMDGAGWHKSRNLAIPKNIQIIILPPYSPELNPVERLWKYIKDNVLKNQVYETLEDLKTATCNFIKNLSTSTINTICHTPMVNS